MGTYVKEYRNTILRSLSPESIERLHLRPITFELGHEIEFPGKEIDRLYFVEEGMASMTATFQDGSQVEVGMFGYESVSGVSGLMGTKRSLNRVYTQIAGSGYYCPIENARREFLRGDRFQILTLSYVQAQLVQTMQSAACNVKHEVDQRLARWLLLCADRAHSTRYIMPHEFLAHMLGNSRTTVTTAAGVLKSLGIIEYTRGAIHILDVKALEGRACECYQVIRDHLQSYAEFNNPATK